MSETNQIIDELPIKKKKGRKPKSYYLDSSNITIEKEPEIKEKKKRGRRSMGGKIVEIKNILISNIPVPNIILHLRCRMSDINNLNSDFKYDPDVGKVDNYTFDNNLQYNYIEDKEANEIENNDDFTKCSDQIMRKNISTKLKELSYNLKHSNIMKKSDCFWCTCNFNNDAIYIPKFELNSSLHCYGNFCSPECAAAYLMNENLDTSVKYERYYLLNNIYSKIYNYTKNIKPAPSPFYLLDKYMGNLDIHEYRKLLEFDKLLLVVEKPLTQVLPEIYEENPDFLINAKIVSKSLKSKSG